MTIINLLVGDLTTSNSDVIVNAAKPSLLGGGGVDGAIHRVSGEELLTFCKKLPSTNNIRCQTGEAVLTPSFNLKSKHIVHTVGPVYSLHSEIENRLLLSSCYKQSLESAIKVGAKSIAFPAISCGSYGYPMEEAAQVALEVCSNKSFSELTVSFYLFSQEDFDIWSQVMSNLNTL